jgi:hypothetical protein
MNRLGISGSGDAGAGGGGGGGVGCTEGGGTGLTDCGGADWVFESDRAQQPESSRDALLVSIATTPTAKTKDSALRTVRMTAPSL